MREYRHASAVPACGFRDEFMEIRAAPESSRFKQDGVMRGGCPILVFGMGTALLEE